MDTSVRVLLVDDEPGIRHVLGALIRDFGYDVHTAESAREALEAFTANPFPIVVTDIRMPGMDGLALLERVRNDIEGLGVVESMPRLEGRQMVMMVAPKKKEPPRPVKPEAAPRGDTARPGDGGSVAAPGEERAAKATS